MARLVVLMVMVKLRVIVKLTVLWPLETRNWGPINPGSICWDCVSRPTLIVRDTLIYTPHSISIEIGIKLVLAI